METLTFLVVTSGYDKLTLIVYGVIFLSVVLGLFSARQKKYGTAQPFKTLIVNSIISYVAILFLIEYSYSLKMMNIKLIILGSFLIGLAADGISTQVINIVDNLDIKDMFSKLIKKENKNRDDKK